MHQNPLWEVPFGDTRNNSGIFGSTPPELLHQYLLGIMKYCWLWTQKYVETHAVNSRASIIIEERFARFNCRHEGMPRTRFTHGVWEAAFMEAKQFPALLWQLVVIIGEKDIILNPQVRQALVLCISNVVRLHAALWDRGGHSTFDIRRLELRIPRMLQRLKDTFAGYSKSDFRCLKYHSTVHLPEFFFALLHCM